MCPSIWCNTNSGCAIYVHSVHSLEPSKMHLLGIGGLDRTL